MINVAKISSVEPGNPFLGDAYNMGTQIGTNVTVMYSKFPTEEHNYVIVVNTKTGERVRVDLHPDMGKI